MSGAYSFLPWLRQGLANEIVAADFDPSVMVRARIGVHLTLNGDKLDGTGVASVPIDRDVALLGPGDIVGIDSRAIVRTDPRDWITSFEPNYLAHIDFYDEDFPWRYTPAAPDAAKGRLRPWLALFVLTEGEFTEGKNMLNRPLPYVDVTDLTLFPRADELWAWAHVHVNRPLGATDSEIVTSDMGAAMPRLAAILAADPDLACSRILCPRKLAEATAYHAFLVPTFESGRRAGLGLPIGDIAATMSAWDRATRPEATSFPYYYRFYFRTGTTGDFETLVRLLTPKPVDPRVGTRDMDLRTPHPNVRGVDKPELGGILRLPGALRPPLPTPPPPDPFESWDDPFPRPLEQDLARFIDLADDYQLKGDPDPIVTPPLYGTWHALVKRVLINADGTPAAFTGNWMHRLNLDPRFRVAAGFGTRVVADQQEAFMNAAWEQVGNVLAAQRKIRLGQLGLAVSESWYERHFAPLAAVSGQKALLVMAPLASRILIGGVTMRHAMGASFLSTTMTSAAMRRALRPRGRLARATAPVALLAAVGRGELSAAPPKVAPAGVVTQERAANLVAAQATRPLRQISTLPIATRPILARRGAESLTPSLLKPSWVNALPQAPGFAIEPVGTERPPAAQGSDSVEAQRFKSAMRDTYAMVNAAARAGAAPARGPFDVATAANDALAALAPQRTVERRVRAGVFLPPRITQEVGTDFVEPMAYPVIDLPMYEPLAKLSPELFLPSIGLVAHNSITLLQVNQRFIEAYMVGLNHEFARELLWREYPTDQRGSTFRQFWDARSAFNAQGEDDDAFREKMRDIPPLHSWRPDSALGTHDQRAATSGGEPPLVLVIRGEVLKRYPNAVIYAHRACWQRKSVTAADAALMPCLRSGGIDNSKERRFVPLTPDEEASPPPAKVRTSLYEAKVDPDIYFFGFDLTVDEVRGGTGENPGDDPGWFFVIKERPGEPRFGLDTQRDGALTVWNDLAWPDVQPGPPGSHIEIATGPAAIALSPPGPGDDQNAAQHAEDANVAWSRDMGAAQLAYILFRAPVLVGVHASELLPPT